MKQFKILFFSIALSMNALQAMDSSLVRKKPMIITDKEQLDFQAVAKKSLNDLLLRVQYTTVATSRGRAIGIV